MSEYIIRNKNNVPTILMQANEYEQSLIKCQYMATVCDQLLRQLQSNKLSKLLLRNKLISQGDNNNGLNRYDRIEFQYKEQSAKDNKEYQVKAKQLQTQINQHQMLIKSTKQQISHLKETRYQGVKNTRLSIKKIKQASQLQYQSLQLRKLLNFQLQNLNTLQSSNIELNQAIQKYQKKERQLKNKITKVLNKDREYLHCRQLQDQYESLLLNKRKLVEQNALIDDKKHSQIFNKITAIAQSNQNLTQMERYQKQLSFMIKQQNFIVQEIQSRQVTDKKEKHKITISDDDNQLFQQEVSNLRKTIANRKFQQRTKNIKTQNKLEDFLNHPTPKNSIHYSKLNQESGKANKKQLKSESIFKIQIEPVSHTNPSNIHKTQSYQREHRHSLPSKISKQPLVKSPMRQCKFQQPFSSQNKLSDFDTVEIAALENIIKKKQSQIQLATHGSPQTQLSNPNYSNLKRTSQLVRNTKNPNKIMYTEPIQSRKQNPLQKNISISPNSRYIEQIIESNSSQHLEKLKNNIRIRTKKTESQKYRQLQARAHINLSQKKNSKRQFQQSKFSSSKTIKSFLEQSKDTTPKNYKNQRNNYKMNISFDSAYDNEFMEIDTRQRNQTEQKLHKLKYKGKLQDLTHEKTSIQNVFEKINLLKKTKQQPTSNNKQKQSNQQQDSFQKRKSKEKVKVFKLSSKRKYGNALNFCRKGKAEGVQDFESQQDSELPKIQEEEESIRNTLQSISLSQR